MKKIKMLIAACILLSGGCIGTSLRNTSATKTGVTATKDGVLLTKTGILVSLPTTNVSYGVVLSINDKWGFFYASITNAPSATNHLGKPMQITVRLNPEADAVDGKVSVRVKRVDVMKIEPER